MNACCMGCSFSPSASPSTVRIFLLLACTANIRQERTGSPSTMTVQAPQIPCSQPMCVTVCPQSSLIASARVRRGSTAIAWSRPLMVRVMLDFMLMMPLVRSSPRKRGPKANVLAVGLDSRLRGNGRSVEYFRSYCLFPGPQQRANSLRRRRQLVDLHSEGRQRIIDCVDNCSRGSDRAAFTETFGARD